MITSYHQKFLAFVGFLLINNSLLSDFADPQDFSVLGTTLKPLRWCECMSPRRMRHWCSVTEVEKSGGAERRYGGDRSGGAVRRTVGDRTGGAVHSAFFKPWTYVPISHGVTTPNDYFVFWWGFLTLPFFLHIFEIFDLWTDIHIQMQWNSSWWAIRITNQIYNDVQSTYKYK